MNAEISQIIENGTYRSW